MSMIPYGRQHIDTADIAAVEAVLRSDWLTQGPAVPRFEAAIATLTEATQTIAVSSATAALHLACLALNLGPGDWLWTTPITFVASANCALYCGARVDFVDIDPISRNLSTRALAEKLAQAARTGRLPKVVIPVHFTGEPCDMTAIGQLAEQYGFHVIEDASHAIGARHQRNPVGNCRHSDCCIFSFHPVKIITTGEGGLISTRNPELADRIRSLRSHGITRDPARMQGDSHGDWYYEQTELGYNYRMSDLQAALGYSQTAKLPEFITRRQTLAARYTKCLAHLPLKLPQTLPTNVSAWHLYMVEVADQPGLRRRVFDHMKAAGIGVNVHYIPVHLQPHYRTLGFADGQFPNAEAYYRRALTLPLYPDLAENQQDYVADQLEAALQQE